MNTPTRRTTAALAATAVIIAAAIGITTRPTGAAGYHAVLSAAILTQQGQDPTFTLQGRLVEDDQPVNRTFRGIIVTLTDASTAQTIDAFNFDFLEVVDGLFTIEIPLPDTEVLLASGPVTAQISVGNTADIGGPISLNYAPRAWTAVRASSAQHADTATTAVALSDAEKLLITPDAPFNGIIIANRIGDLVFLTGTISFTISSTVTTETIAVLPEHLRPQFPQGFIGAPTFGLGTSAVSTSFTVTPDGDIVLSFINTSGSGGASASVNGFFNLTP
ncbi:MAG: hypothetical protein AAGI53_09165 [Planctomycetota bacterium]